MGPVRTVVVRSPTGEGRAVLRALMWIFYGTALLMAAKWCTGGRAATTDAVEPDEIAFRELDSVDQRTFRQAVSGLGEATDLRARTKTWPSVEELAAAGVPPFAPDPIDHAGYQWTLRRDGVVVNYVGTPRAESGRDTFAIVVLEPDPGTPSDPQAVTDEQHTLLPDGTLLHVSIWRGSRTLATATAVPPFQQGWRRVTTRSP